MPSPRKIIVLNLPNSSDHLALIESRPPKPGRRKTIIRRLRWEEGEKEHFVAFRNQNLHLTVAKIQKEYYPERTTRALQKVLNDTKMEPQIEKVPPPTPRFAKRTGTVSPMKRKQPSKNIEEENSSSSSSSDSDTGPLEDISHVGGAAIPSKAPKRTRFEMTTGPQAPAQTATTNAYSPNTSSVPRPASFMLPSPPANARPATSPRVNARNITAPTPSGMRGQHSVPPLRTPERTPGITTPAPSQIMTPPATGIMRGVATNGNSSPGTADRIPTVAPATVPPAVQKRDWTLRCVERFLNELLDVPQSPSPSPTQAAAHTATPSPSPGGPLQPLYAEYWKQSMILGRIGVQLAEQEKTRADSAVREVNKHKEEANKHKEENDRLQEKNTRLEDETKTLRDEVDRLRTNLQKAEERDNEFRRRVQEFLQK